MTTSAGAAYFFKSCPDRMTIIDTTIVQGDSIIIGSHLYNSSGTYLDTFIVQGCDSIVTTNLTISVGINYTPNEQNGRLTLYPNPSNGQITLVLSKHLSLATIEVEVFDRLGKLVHYQKTKNKLINLKQLPKGLYLIRVNKKYSQSFILSD